MGEEDDMDGAEPGVLAPQVDLPGRRVRARRTRPRASTMPVRRMTQADVRVGLMMFPPTDDVRPATRGECVQEERPCPWVGCKHHLYLDVNPETGSLKINFPDLEPWELKETCSLDVASKGGITLEEVGEVLNLTRERVRQVEVRGLLRLKMSNPVEDDFGANVFYPPVPGRLVPRRK